MTNGALSSTFAARPPQETTKKRLYREAQELDFFLPATARLSLMSVRGRGGSCRSSPLLLKQADGWTEEEEEEEEQDHVRPGICEAPLAAEQTEG